MNWYIFQRATQPERILLTDNTAISKKVAGKSARDNADRCE